MASLSLPTLIELGDVICFDVVTVVNLQLLVKSSIYVSPYMNTLKSYAHVHAYLHAQEEVFRINLTVYNHR